MSTSPVSERVEITPELLDAIHEAASAALASPHALQVYRLTICPSVGSALVERIRELEREVEDWKGAYGSAVHSLENVGKPASVPFRTP